MIRAPSCAQWRTGPRGERSADRLRPSLGNGLRRPSGHRPHAPPHVADHAPPARTAAVRERAGGGGGPRTQPAGAARGPGGRARARGGHPGARAARAGPPASPDPVPRVLAQLQSARGSDGDPGASELAAAVWRASSMLSSPPAISSTTNSGRPLTWSKILPTYRPVTPPVMMMN